MSNAFSQSLVVVKFILNENNFKKIKYADFSNIDKMYETNLPV